MIPIIVVQSFNLGIYLYYRSDNPFQRILATNSQKVLKVEVDGQGRGLRPRPCPSTSDSPAVKRRGMSERAALAHASSFHCCEIGTWQI